MTLPPCQGRLSRDLILRNIQAYGVQIILVLPDAPTGSLMFAYTIGMHARFGHELLVFGLRPERAHPLLMALHEGSPLTLDVPLDQYANLPLLLKRCTVKSHLLHRDYVVQADNFYGKKVDVVQVVLPDREGLFPHDPGFDHALMDPLQPTFYMTRSQA